MCFPLHLPLKFSKHCFLTFFFNPSPIAFKFTLLDRYLLCFPSLQTGNCKNFDKWNDWYIFCFQPVFQHPLRKRESSSLSSACLVRHPCLIRRHSPPQRGAPPLTRILKTRHPCQTKCPTRCATPALALFTQTLIGPPAWEWTSKNGFSWSLWITFYSSSFPTVLAREKAREIRNGDKMWGISRWILDSPTSLRKWAAVLAVKWLPAWDGLVRLALNFWNQTRCLAIRFGRLRWVSLSFHSLTTNASIIYALEKKSTSGKISIRRIYGTTVGGHF